MFGPIKYSKTNFFGNKTNTCKFEEDKINCYYNALIEDWVNSNDNPYFENYIINQFIDATINDDYIIINEKHLNIVIVDDVIDIVNCNNKKLSNKYLNKIKNNTLTKSEINEIITVNSLQVKDYEFHFKIKEDETIYLEIVKRKNNS